MHVDSHEMNCSNIYPVMKFHLNTLSKQIMNVTEYTHKLIKLDCIANPNCPIK